jgi:hypothetical protein
MGRWPRVLAGFVVSAMSGCGAADEPAAPGCVPPSRVVAGHCLPPGVQDDGCPAGTLGLPDGSCQEAGVPPDLCGDGFEPDGRQGCEPILPADPCPPGQLALLGETTCHPVMECGAGAWGDIPVEPSTVYVDRSYAGGNSDGSAARPYTTVTEAVAAAAPGAIVAIAAGSYVENVRLDAKPARLYGKCPAEVELVATTSTMCPPAALCILGPATDGTEVHGLAVTGNGTGLVVWGPRDVLVEHVWVHDVAIQGLDVEQGSASVTLRNSLVEGAHDAGVLAFGTHVTIDGAVVRRSLPLPPSPGVGVWAEFDGTSGARATLEMRRALVEDNPGAGVLVEGSDATLDGLVVRGTSTPSSAFARGISILRHPVTGTRSTATVRSAVVTQTTDAGLVVAGSDATLEALVVRGTWPRPTDGLGGDGIIVQIPCNARMCDASQRSIVTVRAALVDGNRSTGFLVYGSDATLEGVVARATLAAEASGGYGEGIAFGSDPVAGARAIGSVRGALVESSHQSGVFLVGSDVQLAGILVRDTMPQAVDQLFGSGIDVVPYCDPECDPATRSTAELRGSLIENNHYLGVEVLGSDAIVDSILVRGTLVRVTDGSFGDGIAVAATRSSKGSSAAHATVTNTRTQGNARAGLGSWGGAVALGASALACNAFDLEGEPLFGPFAFDNLGGNVCGCPEPTGACVAQSVGLAPPDVLPAVPP